MGRPWYQTACQVLVSAFAGILAFGAFLQCLDVAKSLVSTLSAIVGTIIILLLWAAAQLLLKRWGIAWKARSGNIRRFRSMGLRTHMFIAGFVFLLWAGPILGYMMSQPVDRRLGEDQLRRTIPSSGTLVETREDVVAADADATIEISEEADWEWESFGIAKRYVKSQVVPKVERTYRVPSSKPLGSCADIFEPSIHTEDTIIEFDFDQARDSVCNPTLNSFLASYDYFGVIGGSYFQLHQNHHFFDVFTGQRMSVIGMPNAVLSIRCVPDPPNRSKLFVEKMPTDRIHCGQSATFNWNTPTEYTFEEEIHPKRFGDVEVALTFQPFSKGISYSLRVGDVHLAATRNGQNFDAACSDLPTYIATHGLVEPVDAVPDDWEDPPQLYLVEGGPVGDDVFRVRISKCTVR